MVIKAVTFKLSNPWPTLSRFYRDSRRFHFLNGRPFALTSLFWFLLLALLATNILDVLTIAPVPAELVAQHDFSPYFRNLIPTLGVFWAAVAVKSILLSLFFMIVGILRYLGMARSIVLGLLGLGTLTGLVGSALNIINGWPLI
jgi:hypothetical protein